MTRTSHMARVQSSPPTIQSEAFKAIEAEADKIQAAYESARDSLPSSLSPGYKAARAHVRKLGVKLSAIDRKSHDQFIKDNPAWARHWNCVGTTS